ncbi:MAG: hypothetical protein ACE3JQ_05615 [Paenisporosarcina sp.]
MSLFSPPSDQKVMYQEPPKMISAKDLLYLSDMLSWNLLATKKMNGAAENCQLPDLKKEFESAGQMHSKHYDEILKLLKQNEEGAVS